MVRGIRMGRDFGERFEEDDCVVGVGFTKEEDSVTGIRWK
jgi:hypothetical protein